MAPATRKGAAEPIPKWSAFFPEAGDVTLPSYDRNGLGGGETVEGPAVIEDEWSTIVVHPGQRATADHLGNLIIEVHA